MYDYQQKRCSHGWVDVTQCEACAVVKERDHFRRENAKFRAALEEIRNSTYLRHATAVAAKALGFEA